MTCKISRPDPQTLFNQIKDMFSATVLGGGQVIPESNEWYVVANDYAMTEQFYAIADQMWRETNPETACCENLFIIAAQHGVFPRPAGFAEGYVKLTGTPNTSLPASIEVNTSAGTYISVGTVPTALDSNGVAVVRVRALTPGPGGNSSGQVTTGVLTTPVPGINTEVEVCGGTFCGGTDAEDCEAFRQRYLDRLAYKPRATAAWITQKLLEWPCATRVCTREGDCCRCDPECGECGCIGCGDKLEFYVFFDDSFPCGIPPENVVNDMNIWMFGEHQGYGEGQVEVGVCGSLYVAKPVYVNVLIDIAGCPTIAQKEAIEADVRDLFSTICPSVPLQTRQVEVIVANIIGAATNIDVRFEIIDPDPEKAFVTDCSLEPRCDYIPCIQDIEFSTPAPLTGSC